MKLRGKKVLVTGACGFIGSHLVERLMDEGCHVKAFVFYNSLSSWGWLDTFPKKKLGQIEIFTGDVRDPNGVRAAVKGSDAIFHLAALIGIPFSYHSPDSYVDTNIKGTLNILQAARDCDIERIVVTSTSEVYGTALHIPIREDHALQGQSPYSASKIGADKIAEAFRLSFQLPVVIARPFNTYGPRQSARAVIPTIITQLLAGNKTIRLGATHPTRDFVYVKDTVDAFVEIAKSDRLLGEVVNIATQKAISIGTLAERLVRIINPDARIARDSKRLRPRNSEVERLCGNNTKIMKCTGWSPQTDLQTGLRETIDWLRRRDNIRLYRSDAYNI